jgi:hypothetical protein
MEKKKCQFCDQTIQGRQDKKFCDDQCRSGFNNKIYTIHNKKMRYVNAVLKKNRKILESVYFEKNISPITIFESKIQELGFVLNFHTHIQELDGGETCTCCYDYGYISINKGMLAVIKVK